MKNGIVSGILLLAIIGLVLTGIRRPSSGIVDSADEGQRQDPESSRTNRTLAKGQGGGPRPADTVREQQTIVMTFAPGTHGAASNAIVGLLEKYSLPADPLTIETCINAIREVNIQALQLDRYLHEVDDQMDDVRYDARLPEDERARKMRLVDLERLTYKALFTNVLQQAREVGVDALHARLGNPPIGFINDLYSNVPPPMETIQTVR